MPPVLRNLNLHRPKDDSKKIRKENGTFDLLEILSHAFDWHFKFRNPWRVCCVEIPSPNVSRQKPMERPTAENENHLNRICCREERGKEKWKTVSSIRQRMHLHSEVDDWQLHRFRWHLYFDWNRIENPSTNMWREKWSISFVDRLLNPFRIGNRQCVDLQCTEEGERERAKGKKNKIKELCTTVGHYRLQIHFAIEVVCIEWIDVYVRGGVVVVPFTIWAYYAYMSTALDISIDTKLWTKHCGVCVRACVRAIIGVFVRSRVKSSTLRTTYVRRHAVCVCEKVYLCVSCMRILLFTNLFHILVRTLTRPSQFRVLCIFVSFLFFTFDKCKVILLNKYDATANWLTVQVELVCFLDISISPQIKVDKRKSRQNVRTENRHKQSKCQRSVVEEITKKKFHQFSIHIFSFSFFWFCRISKNEFNRKGWRR